MLCFERFSNLCLMKSTYMCLTTFLMKSIYTMLPISFLMHIDTPFTSLWNTLVLIIQKKRKCLNWSWLLLCVERFSKSCLMKSTYTVLTTFLMKSIYTMLPTPFLMHIDTLHYFPSKYIGPNNWKMKMSELFLTPAMSWKIFQFVICAWSNPSIRCYQFLF